MAGVRIFDQKAVIDKNLTVFTLCFNTDIVYIFSK